LQSKKLEKLNEQKQEIAGRFKELNLQKRALKEEIIKLNDEHYLAELASIDYFFSKSNEIIFVLPFDYP
jgi:cell division protein FtsB